MNFFLICSCWYTALSASAAFSSASPVVSGFILFTNLFSVQVMISSEIIWQFYDFSKNDLLSVNSKVKPTHCFIYFLTDFPPFLRWCQCKRSKNYFSLQIWWQINVLFFIQDFLKKKGGFIWLDLFSLERPFQYTLKWNVLDLIAVNICLIFTAQNLLEIKLRLMCAWV